MADYAEQLGSMDRAQLRELLNYLSDERSAEMLVGGTGGGPHVRNAVGGDFFGGENPQWHDRVKNIASHFSGYGMYKRGRKAKADKEAESAYYKARAEEVQRTKELMAERKKMVENQLRTLDLKDEVGQQFDQMNLSGLLEKMSKEGLDNSLLGITQQHQDLSRETGFNAVSQGLGGSSVDAERVADIQASQEQASSQAAAQAQSQLSMAKNDLNNQKQQLLSSVSGGNQGEQARLSGQLNQLQTQTGSYGNMLAGQMYGNQIQQQSMAGQSQALGGLLSNYANLYTPTSRQQNPLGYQH